jgi:hypothetical protein
MPRMLQILALSGTATHKGTGTDTTMFRIIDFFYLRTQFTLLPVASGRYASLDETIPIVEK